LDLAEAIRIGDPSLVATALRRLADAPAAEWAVELNQAWDQGRADIALGAITRNA